MAKQLLSNGRAYSLPNATLSGNGVIFTDFDSISYKTGGGKWEYQLGSNGVPVSASKTFDVIEGEIVAHAEMIAKLQSSSSTGKISDLSPMNWTLTFFSGPIEQKVSLIGCLMDEPQLQFSKDQAFTTGTISMKIATVEWNDRDESPV